MEQKEYNFKENVSNLFLDGQQFAKQVRADYSLNKYSLETAKSRNKAFFDFGDYQILEHDKKIKSVIRYSYEILQKIIVNYFNKKNIGVAHSKIEYFFDNDELKKFMLFKKLDDNDVKNSGLFDEKEIKKYWLLKNIEFLLLDVKKEKALLFANLNFLPLFIGPVNEEINDLLHAKSYEVVTCTFSETIDFIINKKANDGDKKVFITFSEFLNKYFEKDDSLYLLDEINKYKGNIKKILGYSMIKNISYNSSVFFNKKIQTKILSQDYINSNDFVYSFENDKKLLKLTDNNLEILKNIFFKNDLYLLLLRNEYFSESLRTAEWLYDSIEHVDSIDLSTIALGYFKSIEQLLTSIIYVKKNYAFDIQDIKNDRHTLGDIAHYLLNNLKWLNYKIDIDAKEYVVYKILDYAKQTRNGYAHKHNINDKDEISRIRNETFNLLFLILSTIYLNENQINMLGGTSLDYYDDFYKLCEYVNFHAGLPVFYIVKTKKDKFVHCVSQRDPNIVDSKDHFIFSGAYFKIIESTTDLKEYVGNMIALFEKDINGIDEIRYMELGFVENAEDIRFDFSKYRTLFKNGKYVGPDSSNYDINY